MHRALTCFHKVAPDKLDSFTVKQQERERGDGASDQSRQNSVLDPDRMPDEEELESAFEMFVVGVRIDGARRDSDRMFLFTGGVGPQRREGGGAVRTADGEEMDDVGRAEHARGGNASRVWLLFLPKASTTLTIPTGCGKGKFK